MIRNLLFATAMALATCAAPVFAQGFDAQVLPPRFEDSAKAGTVYRNVIEIQNQSLTSTRYGIRTADWVLNETGEAEFDYALAPGSCRPWVGLEANEVVVDPQGRKRLRFEVAVPADAVSGQCRFAIMIEGPPHKTASGMAVAGRIGIIVYLTVGDGAARLSVVDIKVAAQEGQEVPVLRVHNDGNAHGRLQGFLSGLDADGKRWTLLPSGSPILPGDTRDIPLFPVSEKDEPRPVLSFPMQLRGQLDWSSQRIPVEGTAAR